MYRWMNDRMSLQGRTLDTMLAAGRPTSHVSVPPESTMSFSGQEVLDSVSVTTEDTWRSLTVPVDVLVTGVSLSVAVRVPLVAVGDVGTVITGVSKRVAVRVLLVLVWDQTAVVLRDRG